MASMDEKVVVSLREDRDEGTIHEMSVDGKEQRYYTERFDVVWLIESLQIRKEFAFRNENDLTPPAWRTFLRGKARLHSHKSLGLIGAQEKLAKIVEFSFKSEDSENLLKKEDRDKSKPFETSIYEPVGRASLGFNRADWESQSEDQWWLACYIHSTALEPLIEGVRDSSLSELLLHTSFKNLFTDEPPIMPSSRFARLFLRPKLNDNTIDFPEIAQGWLEQAEVGMSLFATAQASTEIEDTETPEEIDRSEMSLAKPQVQDHRSLELQFEAFRKTVKWLGSFIVIALILLVMK